MQPILYDFINHSKYNANYYAVYVNDNLFDAWYYNREDADDYINFLLRVIKVNRYPLMIMAQFAYKDMESLTIFNDLNLYTIKDYITNQQFSYFIHPMSLK